MASTSVTRTLYDDWRDRRDRLRASGTESADAVLHLRVLNYLLDRYRDVAASLEPAAPLLDAVLVNHRAIVLNHHFGQGQVAGVKNRREADGRMARIIQRMQDRDRADEEEEFLSGPTPHVIRPEVSYYVTSHWAEIDRRRGPLRRETAKRMLAKYPFLPERFIERLAVLLLELDRDVLEVDIELLESCLNQSAATALVDSWRRRVEAKHEESGSEVVAGAKYNPLAAREFAKIVARFEQGILRHHNRSARRLRPMLADQSAAVRVRVSRLLGHVGSLRDVALLSDLLALAPSADDHPRERLVIAESMHNIARREGTSAGDA